MGQCPPPHFSELLYDPFAPKLAALVDLRQQHTESPEFFQDVIFIHSAEFALKSAKMLMIDFCVFRVSQRFSDGAEGQK